MAGLSFGGGALAMIVWGLLEAGGFPNRIVHVALVGLGFGGSACGYPEKLPRRICHHLRQIRTCGVFGLFEKVYTMADIDAVILKIDSLPIAGSSPRFELFRPTEALRRFPRQAPQRRTAALLNLAFYLARLTDKPLVLKGKPVSACPEFLNLFIALTRLNDEE